MTLVIKQGEIGAFVGDYFHQWINTKSVFTVMKEHIHNKEERDISDVGCRRYLLVKYIPCWFDSNLGFDAIRKIKTICYFIP